jgi:predicted MarR family transcription regulator
MSEVIDATWHLAENDEELKLVDFEFLFWRTYHSWVRWQEDCQSCIANEGLTAAEIALLHVIRVKDRPKTIYELGRLLNRDDTPNIQYGIKKLAELGYVEKVNVKSGAKKAVAYKITKKGINNTDAYSLIKKNTLCRMLKNYETTPLKFDETIHFLSTIKGIFEESSRLALTASYKDNTTKK